MALKKGDIRILNAEWHPRHGELVEIILSRKGITKEYLGKKIFHVAYSPINENRKEDLDEEFIEKNFKFVELEKEATLICLNDILDGVGKFSFKDEFYKDKSFDKDLSDAIIKIKEIDDVKTWVYFMFDTIWISFGNSEDDAIKNAPKYFMSTVNYKTRKKPKK